MKNNLNANVAKKQSERDVFGLKNDLSHNEIKMVKVLYESEAEKGESIYELFVNKESAKNFISKIEGYNGKIMGTGIGIYNKPDIYFDGEAILYEDNSELEIEYKNVKFEDIPEGFGNIDCNTMLKVINEEIIEKVSSNSVILTINGESIDCNVLVKDRRQSLNLEVDISFPDTVELDSYIKTVNIDRDNLSEIISYKLGHREEIEKFKHLDISIDSKNIYTNLSIDLTIDVNGIDEIEVGATFSDNEFGDAMNYELIEGDLEVFGIKEDEFFDYMKGYFKKSI